MSDQPPGQPLSDEDENLRILARWEPPPSQINDTVVGVAAIVGALCAVGFAVGLALGWPLTVYGSLLASALILLAIAVRRYFVDRFPEVEAAEPRRSATVGTGPGADVPLSAVEPLARRPLLTRVLGGAAAVVGASLLAFVPSLGPRVGSVLESTPWRRGLPLVTGDGQRVRPEDVAVGGALTAWPQGHIGFERAAVIVLRLRQPPLEPTVLDWVVSDTIVAYSKICTHAGCPVALFRERDNALFCPCHQSTFDAREGAVPIFGPAARALPQLPLRLDADGFLVALGDFEEQVGPAFG